MPSENLTLAMLANTTVLIRELQSRANELTLTTGALLMTLFERDPTFAEAYIAHHEELENGETGKNLAATLAGMDQLIEQMNAML